MVNFPAIYELEDIVLNEFNEKPTPVWDLDKVENALNAYLQSSNPQLLWMLVKIKSYWHGARASEKARVHEWLDEHESRVQELWARLATHIEENNLWLDWIEAHSDMITEKSEALNSAITRKLGTPAQSG